MKILLRTATLFFVWIVAPNSASACSLGVPGAKCLRPPASNGVPKTQDYKVGDQLPRGEYMVLIGTKHYGLPPASAGALYFNVDGRALRVHAETMEVLEDVTHLLRRNLR